MFSAFFIGKIDESIHAGDAIGVIVEYTIHGFFLIFCRMLSDIHLFNRRGRLSLSPFFFEEVWGVRRELEVYSTA